MSWFFEMLAVVMLSKRVHWMIIIGVVAATGLHFVGVYHLSTMGVEDAIAAARKDGMAWRYDKGVQCCLVTSWIAAFGFYKKDKNIVFR